MSAWARFEAELRSRQRAAEGQHIATFFIPEALPVARAGQFVQLRLPEVFWPRPFSLLSWEPGPAGTTFQILFAEAGRGTRALASLAAGARIMGHGPLGNGFPPISGPTWLIGGGYGVAPLLFAARTRRTGASPAAPARPGAAAREIRFFYGARTSALLWRSEELDSLSPTLATVDGTCGFHGTVLAAVESELRAGGGRPAIYSCGPMGLLQAVAALALEAGLLAHLSVETPMPCGIGVCRGCALPLAPGQACESRRWTMACEDGPVFESRELDWSAEEASRT